MCCLLLQRGLVGEIIKRFEQKGFKLVGLRMLNVERSLAEKHYADLSSKPFFGALVDYIVSGPVVAMVSLHAFFLLFMQGHDPLVRSKRHSVTFMFIVFTACDPVTQLGSRTPHLSDHSTCKHLNQGCTTPLPTHAPVLTL